MKPLHAIYAALAITACACSPSIPSDAIAVDKLPEIYPDYAGTTVPRNIAPLNFTVGVDADKYAVRVRSDKGQALVCDKHTTDFDISKWHALLADADSLMVDVFARSDGRWQRMLPIKIYVAEPIDRYVAYRLIEPSYIGFKQMSIRQRDLETFDEREIWNNCNVSLDDKGQCINCHAFQNYNRQGNMQMHLRFNHGGTLIRHDGNTTKVSLKTDSTISAGVYPAWHPTLPLIAYSNNTTTQSFHTNMPNKVEVADGQSDLILYDINANKVHIVANDSTELESFPAWSPDGKYLYYVSAQIPLLRTDNEVSEFKHTSYDRVKYNIYRKPFCADSLTFGATDTVFLASERQASATLPRISPDGRYLLFAMGRYGTFHVWHKEADLYIMDLDQGTARPLDEINSDESESYHSWSSTGRWIVVGSRRDDGSYTRLYFAYFSPDGVAHKPFLMPQRHPKHNAELYKSYNVPEFLVEPVDISRPEMIELVKSQAIDAQI